MQAREMPTEVVELNKELAEFWIDEVDMLSIHQNCHLEIETRVLRAINKTHKQQARFASILRGRELRHIFGYTSD